MKIKTLVTSTLVGALVGVGTFTQAHALSLNTNLKVDANTHAEGMRGEAWQKHKASIAADYETGILAVTKVEGDLITAVARDREGDLITWYITQEDQAVITYRGGGSEITTNNYLLASGQVTDNEGSVRAITADQILVVQHKAKSHIRGEITAIDTENDTITVNTKKRGEVTIEAQSETMIKDENNEAITFSDLVVGATIKAKGMWNSILDVMTAAKIKITG